VRTRVLEDSLYLPSTGWIGWLGSVVCSDTCATWGVYLPERIHGELV
jgi:hypothetical protein